jgi:hypothetical protein
MKRTLSTLTLAVACVVGATPTVAQAQTWASWNLPQQCNGPVSGGLATYSGVYNAVQNASGGRSCGTITENGGGNNFWVPATPYTPTPNNRSFIQFNAAGGPNTITFNQAVINPYIALISVGQGGVGVTYDFNQAFSVVSSNTSTPAYWGTGTHSVQNSNTRLLGNEFSGVLMFAGTFSAGSQITFNVRSNEVWHGFTVGAAKTVVPEPSSFALLGAGVLAMGFVARRRRLS